MTSPRKTILIVDDSLEDRHSYHRYLNRDLLCTYSIIEAETGETGLELFDRHNPDLILLDFNLPDLNGLEFISQLKADYLKCDGFKQNCLPPIIILTGEGSETIAVELMKAGVKDYLVKGKTSADSLCFAVRSLLEQARLQQLAQSHEDKFRVSVENMLDCFGIYSSIRDENSQIVGFQADYLNESACQDNLFARQEVTELGACLAHVFDLDGELFALCCEVIETGEAIAIEYSFKTLASDSGARDNKVFEIKIDRIEDGFVAVWRDISDRIETERALETSEAKFRTLVTQAPVGIFQTDCLGDCVYVNPRWLEITGLKPENAMGRGWSVALHPQDKARIYQEWYEAAQLGQEFTSEYRFCAPNGQITWVSCHAVAMHNDLGEQIGYFGTIININERKQAEVLSQRQQKQLIKINQHLEQTTSLLTKRNQELDEFSYVVSHDLKAPLRAIYQLSAWLEEDLQDKLDSDTQHNFNLLQNRVGRMRQFIDSLLEYARIGREKARPETFTVKDLIADIVDSLAPESKYTIDIGAMPTLSTQKVALEQVFTNLISNAIKHHYAPSAKITISARETAEFHYFTVTDDGAGIAPEHQERIFGIFQTLSSRDRHENTGIGLSIVKKIVENQGGTIDLKSQVGKGTSFTFSWQK